MDDEQPGPDRWPADSMLALAPAGTADQLLRLGSRRLYRNGESLLRDGDRDRHVLLVLHGCVKVLGTTRSGRPTLLAIRSGGDLLGEQAALDGGPRSATAVSVGSTIVREIAAAEFLRLLRADPEAGIALSRYLSAKLRRATRYRVDVGGNPVVTRLAVVLCELADRHGRAVPEGLRIDTVGSQSQLAAAVGTTVPTLERALRRLREVGVIGTGYRTVVVKDAAALSAIAESPTDHGG